MRAVWDPGTARATLLKHGVRFADAECALFDPQAITTEDQTVRGERRFVSIGLDSLGRVLGVVYRYRDDNVRLISARRAICKERDQHEAAV